MLAFIRRADLATGATAGLFVGVVLKAGVVYIPESRGRFTGRLTVSPFIGRSDHPFSFCCFCFAVFFFLGCFGFLLACSLGLQTFPIYLQIPKSGYLGQRLPLSS